MADPVLLLNERLRAAVAAAFGDEHASSAAMRRSSHGDYQAEVALALAKKLKKPPREVAQAIVDRFDTRGAAEKIEIAGPGFVNVTAARELLEAALAAAASGDLIRRAERPDTVVIDYSSPNVAKEMHVGHIRSTILGDALARTHELLGNRVIRQNHLGDWGTPFGMLIEQLEDTGTTAITDLNAFYRDARAKFDADASFAERARRRVVALQAGDEGTLAHWRRLVAESRKSFAAIYQRLGVTLTDDDVCGESFFNPKLAEVTKELRDKGLVVESDGALCMFVPGFKNREGEPLPLIVQKQDGGYGYAATDLAAIRHRAQVLGATRILYVVGAPQRQHLEMIFEAGRMAGWLDHTKPEHVAFGSILGSDKKMFRTRSGDGTVGLDELLEEAEQRALVIVKEKSPDLPAEEQQRVAATVGLAAIKYADLSSDRIKDYVFDWARMLAVDGNTGPYLMYAYARTRSILRKAAGEGAPVEPGAMSVSTSQERALAFEILGVGSVVEQVALSSQPHKLCSHLYGLATAFTAFFEHCPVLKGGTDRASRLRLCELTARTLGHGLELLGITPLERM